MQDMDQYGNTCRQTTASNTVTYTLVDHRENPNKSYLTAKLGNYCWMVQNLALYGNQTINSTYSNTNGNFYITSSTTDPTQYYTTNTETNKKTMYNGLHKSATADNTTDNTGSFYTYEETTAGTASAILTSYYNTTYDICPLHWRLPSANGRINANTTLSGEVSALLGGNTQFFTFYNSGVGYMPYFKWAYTGYCHTAGCPMPYNHNSHYWTSTIGPKWSDAEAAFALRVSNTSGSDRTDVNTHPRTAAFSIRCIAAST